MALPDDCNKGDYVFKRENPMTWMATAPCYDDPQMSPVGYGATQEEAVDDRVQQPQFQEFLKRSGRQPPTFDSFMIDDRPYEQLMAKLDREGEKRKAERGESA